MNNETFLEKIALTILFILFLGIILSAWEHY